MTAAVAVAVAIVDVAVSRAKKVCRLRRALKYPLFILQIAKCVPSKKLIFFQLLMNFLLLFV